MSKLIDSVNAADKSLRELLSTVSVEGKDCTCVFLALTLVESVKKELEQGERGDELKKMVEDGVFGTLTPSLRPSNPYYGGSPLHGYGARLGDAFKDSGFKTDLWD